jgi:hypothetical protein
MPPPPSKMLSKVGPDLPMVPLPAVMAVEKHPPKEAEALLWVLLTNLNITSVDEAIEKVQWYAQRWNIKVFRKVLKPGCAVEDAQLCDARRLKKCVVVKSIIWLTSSAEQSGPFAPHPLHTLHHYYGPVRPCATHRYSGPRGPATWTAPFASRRQVPRLRTRA